jgi:malate dehydrogenase (oxaloacetate-decarboxylating)(NADP+)
LNQAALDYHEKPKPGKIVVELSKPTQTQRDLALAYSPGVAEPVRRIAANEQDAYRYTGKGNFVAMITNGTAVLGLGNVGPLAGKPVMEGKGVLFKHFADIDVFDSEVNAKRPQAFIETVMRIAPTFGGITVEDIAAPQCFEIEQAPKDLTRDPVPSAVLDADGLDHLEFGPHYILPKPLNARLKEVIPPAVAGAAIDSGVARVEWPSHSPSRS